MRSSVLVLAAAGLLLASVSGETYFAEMDGAADDAITTATGVVMLETTKTSATYQLNFTDVENAYQAHLHYGSVNVTDGPIVVYLLNPVMPYISVEGTVVVTGTFNKTAFVGPLAGESFSALIDALETGNIYANLHNEAYPNGLLRGQVGYEPTADM